MAKTTLGEVRDQSLHFLMCFSLAFVTLIGRPYLWVVPIALLIAYGFAMTREYYQHGHIVWINFDLCFGAGGSVAGAAVPFLIWS